MSRSGYDDGSGYDDDGGDNLTLYRRTVYRAIKGKRGRSFLTELAAAMDAMAVKELIAHDLERDGAHCALGVVGAKRGVDMASIDPDDASSVGKAFGVAWQLAAEIEYMNDEYGHHAETDAQRWSRMRRWVQQQIDNPKYE